MIILLILILVILIVGFKIKIPFKLLGILFLIFLAIGLVVTALSGGL